jgi:hypothetical protein
MEEKGGQEVKGFELAMLRGESLFLAGTLLIALASCSCFTKSVEVCLHEMNDLQEEGHYGGQSVRILNGF